MKKNMPQDQSNKSDQFYFQDDSDQFEDACIHSQNESQIALDLAIIDEQLHQLCPEFDDSSIVQPCQNNPVETTKSSSEYLKESQNQESDLQSQKQYLRLKRRPKGFKYSIQRNLKGYWTKNLLQFGKIYHFQFINKKMGQNFIKQHKNLKQIFRTQKGMTKREYKYVYRMQELKQVWQQFFRLKFLYRALMLSRTKVHYKVVYLYFMEVFEKAYRSKKFGSVKGLLKLDVEQMMRKSQ